MHIVRLQNYLRFCSFVLLFLSFQVCSAQTEIAGVVNEYFKVGGIDTSLCPPEITTEAEHTLAVGDKVLLIQMNGVACNFPLDLSYGEIADYQNAGNYEFLIVEEISANSFKSTASLSNDYDPGFAVQAIKVPVYESAVVVGDISPLPWDGQLGGVIAVDVLDELELLGNLVADGMGFRGGSDMLNAGFECEAFDLFYTSAQSLASEKGEGLYPNDPAMQYGTGAIANAGGGGNKSNSGGGGGSNFSAGGQGGFQSADCFFTDVGGKGGWQIDDFEKRAFMGGGGGAGQSELVDDLGMPTSTAGTNGGGIIFVKAGKLVGNSFSISAAGLNQDEIALSGGGGGAGAGGTVVFEVASFEGLLTLKVNGGNGGKVDGGEFAAFDCFGPGGGGGAGVMKINATSIPEGILSLASQGLAGVELNTVSNCFNTPNGAENGASPNGLGVVDSFAATPAEPILDLGADNIQFCEGDSAQLAVEDLFQQYTWSTGDTMAQIWVYEPGIYSLEVLTSCGTKSAEITVLDHPTFPETGWPADTTLCEGQILELDLSGVFDTVLWMDSSTSETYSTEQSGTITATVENAEACQKELSINVNFVEASPLDLGEDRYFCETESATIEAPEGFQTYEWDNGLTGSSLEVISEGYYTLTTSDTNNCVAEDVLFVGFRSAPAPELPTTETICLGQSKFVDPGYFDSYQWSTGSTDRVLQLTEPGTIELVVMDEYGCTAERSMEVTTYCEAGIQIVNAFSPNGDGVNDVFRVISTPLEQFELLVHDRWGKLIFASNDPNLGWDGDFEGEALPIGTYVWFMQAEYMDNGQLVSDERSGNITLVR